VVWPGDLDLAADRLWEMALEQQGRHDALEFLRWSWRWRWRVEAGNDGLQGAFECRECGGDLARLDAELSFGGRHPG
jgi:hypothetical protein